MAAALACPFARLAAKGEKKEGSTTEFVTGIADPPGMKRRRRFGMMCGSVAGNEIDVFLGAREPFTELDPGLLSTPECATSR